MSPEFRLRNRAELVDALGVAAQIEHVVLLEYLYAAFSCRHTEDATLPARVALASWDAARELYLIAHQEMDHLGTVQQLLAALGAPPVPDAWSLPVRDSRLPFPCELTRLDLNAVDRFIRTESPAPRHAPVDGGAAASPPDPVRFDALGELYHDIIRGIDDLGEEVFLGAGVTGPAPLELRFSRDGYPVSTPAAAVASLREIVTEGEGPQGAGPAGHLQRFRRMHTLLAGLGDQIGDIAWPCVPNPVVRDSGTAGTTLVTHPVSAAVGDIANRTYRALWLLLGGTFTYDWSPHDPLEAQARRGAQRARSTAGARWLMAAGLRPLGELMARLPAHEADHVTGGERLTAGMTFEQYGEFRVPSQPDARLEATLAELGAVATDLDAIAADPDLATLGAVGDHAADIGARLAAVAADVRTIRDRLAGTVIPRATGRRFEPPTSGRWLTVDFSGWYQVRLATGGDPYNDPRGVSGWQFAFPGEPDLDRVLRLQPAGTYLREYLSPAVRVGVRVDTAGIDDGPPLDGFAGATVDLLDEPRFEGHNGVVAPDGSEPIVPFHLSVTGPDLHLQRSALDQYAAPYPELVSLGSFGGLPAAAALRGVHGLPASGASPEIDAYLADARATLQSAAEQSGDDDRRAVLEHRRDQIGTVAWSFAATVAWRFPLRGAGATATTPGSTDAPVTGQPWWIELISTGFDPDAGCALLRGVLHAPLDDTAGPPPWRIALPAPAEATSGSAGALAMPVDEMGVRPGR